MTAAEDPLHRLKQCPPGHTGWREFEDICTSILRHLFVPPLREPKIQARTLSGIDRRDAVFPNRNIGASSIWGHLYQELGARMILFEFKNYDTTKVGKDEVDQTRVYLTQPMGRLAILCCNKEPEQSAYIRRNTIFSQDDKVILFLLPRHLQEMCFIKERGEDPADLIMDLVEEFYLQHE